MNLCATTDGMARRSEMRRTPWAAVPVIGRAEDRIDIMLLIFQMKRPIVGSEPQ